MPHGWNGRRDLATGKPIIPEGAKNVGKDSNVVAQQASQHEVAGTVTTSNVQTDTPGSSQTVTTGGSASTSNDRYIIRGSEGMVLQQGGGSRLMQASP